MQTRRTFLRNAAMLLPAAGIAGRAWAAEPIPLGAQLYTVRRQAEQDLPHVLEQIAHIGYTEVETYGGLYTNSANALRHMIEGAGLKAPSAHFGYDEFDSRFNYAEELGVGWMVCSAIAPSLWNSPEGFATAAKQFNAWGQRAKDMGMRFAFHNHDYEFRPQANGRTGYDILVDQTDPHLVFFEIDCYWAAQGGLDPIALMRGTGHRLKMLHLKDRLPGFPPSFAMNADSAHFTEVGHGTLDWKGILAEAQTLSVEHYFVEQDQATIPPMESLRRSYDYLRKIT
ncbi:MAG TPA: sugar phosphate isomerase/epimerase [Acidobacteriaceae bacterium]|nr:sugar phosphate isomerase/epimerase [Acidobacteriaceae bacterium]